MLSTDNSRFLRRPTSHRTEEKKRTTPIKTNQDQKMGDNKIGPRPCAEHREKEKKKKGKSGVYK
jgi:hypothetical protein